MKMSETTTSLKERKESPWLFYGGRFLFDVIYRLLWRKKVYGHENIPATGGVIIAPNHVSFADPPLVGSSMKRALHFMAKQELFDLPVLGFLIRRTNAFPIRRGQQDVSALRGAIKLVKSGEPLLIFPEGSRSKDGNFRSARAGVGMIACMAQVPVVPVRIFNSGRLLKFAPLRVVFGKPLYPPKECTRETYESFSRMVLDEVKKLQLPQ
jgi:1-acyl-sn-glycerol-3-phosphate acyltransferase